MRLLHIASALALGLGLTSFHSVHADETLSAQVGSALHELDVDAGKKLTALQLWIDTQSHLESDLNARIENMRYELSVKERSLHEKINKAWGVK